MQENENEKLPYSLIYCTDLDMERFLVTTFLYTYVNPQHRILYIDRIGRYLIPSYYTTT